MKIRLEDIEVEHREERQRFEMQVGNLVAVLDYSRQGKAMVITHTGVPTALEGQGIASKLTKFALEYARAEGLKVVPLCSFAQVYIQRHPEYKELV